MKWMERIEQIRIWTEYHTELCWEHNLRILKHLRALKFKWVEDEELVKAICTSVTYTQCILRQGSLKLFQQLINIAS